MKYFSTFSDWNIIQTSSLRWGVWGLTWLTRLCSTITPISAQCPEVNMVQPRWSAATCQQWVEVRGQRSLVSILLLCPPLSLQVRGLLHQRDRDAERGQQRRRWRGRGWRRSVTSPDSRDLSPRMLWSRLSRRASTTNNTRYSSTVPSGKERCPKTNFSFQASVEPCLHLPVKLVDKIFSSFLFSRFKM